MIYRIKSLVRKGLKGEDVYFCLLIDQSQKDELDNGELVEGKYPNPMVIKDGVIYSWNYGVLDDISSKNEAHSLVISDFNIKEIDWVEHYFNDVLSMHDYFKIIKIDGIDKPISDIKGIDNEISNIDNFNRDVYNFNRDVESEKLNRNVSDNEMIIIKEDNE